MFKTWSTTHSTQPEQSRTALDSTDDRRKSPVDVSTQYNGEDSQMRRTTLSTGGRRRSASIFGLSDIVRRRTMSTGRGAAQAILRSVSKNVGSSAPIAPDLSDG